MMTSENIGIFTEMGWAESRPTLWNDLRLTAKERRLLLRIVDLLLVNGTLLAAVGLWNGFALSPESVLANIKWFATISVLWLVAGTILDIYNLVRAAHMASILPNVGMAALLSTLLYLAIPWLSPPLEHRIYALGLVLSTTASLITWRIFYARVLVHTAFASRALVVGSGESVLALAHAIAQADQVNDTHSSRYIGYEIVGRVVDGAAGTTSDEIPVLGDADRLVYLARQYAVDEIVLAHQDEQVLSPDVLEILLDCRELGFRISSFASVYERLTGRLPVEYAHCDLRLLLSPADSPAFRLYLAAKRALDVLMALVGLLVLGVLLPFVALGNALTSPGPLFYRQERMSKGGRPFTVFKLRSMSQNAERCSGAVWSRDHDPRITPMGRWLRKTRLDELPQVINVLRGEMSMVGPRPERPHFVGQLAHTFPLYRARHAVKPGITGWAQVNYEYGNSVEDARIKLEYDLYYVKHASFYLDLLILLHTVRTVVGLKGQ